MSIEKPKTPGTSDPHVDTQMEQKELLRNALQESYEMNLKNLDLSSEVVSRSIGGIIRNIEGVSGKKDLSLDVEAFQGGLDTRLKTGDIDGASTIDKLAKERKIQLEPVPEYLQSCYEINIEKESVYTFKKVEEFARINNITLKLDKDILQKGFDRSLEHFDSYDIKNIKEFADKNGIELEIKKEILQKVYDSRWNQPGDLEEIYKIEEFAKQNQINLEFREDVIQKGFEQYIEYGHAYDMEKWLEGIKKFENYASTKGIEIKIEQDKIQQLLEKGLIEGDNEVLDKAQNLSREKGMALNLSSVNLQEIFDGFFSDGKLFRAEVIQEFAKKNDIIIEIPNKEKLQEKIQQEYDAKLASGKIFFASLIQEVGKKQGIDIQFKNDIFQRGYDLVCKDNEDDDIESFTVMAEENGVEIKSDKEIREKMYIGAIHNLNLSHVTVLREEMENKLKEFDSDLTYEKAIKMDYLEHLGVPEEQRLNMEKTVKIENVPVTARFYGQKQETPVQGKFIIGITPDNTLEFVADSTLGEHKDIGGKYDLEIIGGGWLEIDEQNKKVKIYKSSQDFGYEPRSISKKVIADVFTEYEVIVEN